MLKRIFTNREFLLVLSLVLGLVQGQASMYTVPLVLPILGVIMTLSTMMISGRELRSLRTLMAPFLWGIVMNYLILSGATLATAAWLIEDPELWRGFVILAAVPPAVAVIPFTDFLRGNHSYALIGTTGAYLAGLLLMPAIAVAFLGSAVVQPARLVFIILSLIVGPFLISRLILWLSWDRWIQPLKGSITNWCFFVVTYTIVGSNRHVILSNPLGLMPVLAVAVITIICLGFMVEYGARFLKVGSATWRALIFLGTLKNYGLAGGVSLTLFNTKTALPATVGVIVMVLYVVLLQLRARMN
ncbi:MAG: hypothetical protein P8165_09600 [Deltaproteobacteria bacterium]